MIQTALTISLICLAIHALFWEGMILFKIGHWTKAFFCMFLTIGLFNDDVEKGVEGKISEWMCKPLFDCLICMSSVWTLIIGHFYFGLTYKLIPVMLIVCGINVILDSFVYYLRDGGSNKL